MRVLLIEDEPTTAKAIETMLTVEGFNVYTTDLGEEGLDLGKLYDYDIILLDLNLPDMHGYDVLKKLRVAKVQTPVLILSGISEMDSKVRSFGFGADDYVTKPFGIMELLSRIRSVLRRTRKPQEAGKKLLSFDGIVVDQEQHSVTSGGREVQLTLKEFDLLCYLLLNKGIVLSRDQIMQAVWDSPFEMESRTIDMHIMSLRQKLGNEGACIRTVRGVGYRLGDRKS